jgi:hypothetical protein
MMELVSMQQFDGSFALDVQLCNLVGIDMGAMSSLAQVLHVSEDAAATALALAVLDHRFSGFQEDWQLVALKVRIWCRPWLRHQ